MANAKDELKALRAFVKKRRNAVTAKENRIKRNTGVDIRNTAQDPRRPLTVVDKYNKSQLTKYLSDLESFMSRSVGYVGGSGNTPLPKLDWLRYKKLENKYNKIGMEHFNAIADIFIPQAGMTISQRDKTLVPDSISAQGAIVNRPYSPIDRKPNNIPSQKALDKLIADMNKKVSGKFLPEKLQEGRGQLNTMLNSIGNPELISEANLLTDSQFDILWNYTNFASNVSGIYFLMMKNATDDSGEEMEKGNWWDSVVEDYSDDIRELFSWARSQPENSRVVQFGNVKIVNPGKAGNRKKRNGNAK
jgi:hypothetical protein